MRPTLDLLGHGGAPDAWVVILADSTIKGAGVLMLAWLAVALLRRRPATVRHLVWTLALVGIGVLPVVSASVPGWRAPILPHSVGGNVPTTGQTGSADANPFRLNVAPEQILSGVHGLPAASATERPIKPEPSSTASGWAPWVLTVWVGGVTIVLAQLAVSLLCVWHKGCRTAAVTEGAWTLLAADVAKRYGIRRRVALRLVPEGTIPATCGFWRPVVFFPVDSLDWPRERIRAVLLHELAHVARGDFLVQALARAACALHWFNPLAWHAARRLRRESEQASDDLALGAGLTPAGYASQLIEVLMAARDGREAASGLLAMARRGELEDRVRAILDDARSHRVLSSRWVALTALAAVGLFAPFALVRLEAEAQDAPNRGTLPEGMTVEVVGVSTHPSGSTTWWGPDGKPLSTAPCDPAERVTAVWPRSISEKWGGTMLREVVVRVTGLPDGAKLSWHPSQCASVGTPTPEKEGTPVPGLLRCVAEFQQELASCPVQFSISLGDWITEYTCDERGTGIEKHGLKLLISRAHETRQGTVRAVTHNILDRDVRLVAIDAEGREHEGGLGSSGATTMKMLEVEFDLPLSQIREYRLQSRRLVRFRVNDVALQPRKVGE